MKVDIVKLDIEGAKLPALLGMEKTIAISPGLHLILEYAESMFERNWSDRDKLCDLLDKWFRTYLVSSNGDWPLLRGPIQMADDLRRIAHRAEMLWCVPHINICPICSAYITP